jgi:hypothetical protein
LPAIIGTVVSVVLSMVESLNPTNTFLSMLSTVFNIGSSVLLGGYGIKLVHNNFQKLKNEITTRISDKDLRIQEMRKQGGFIPIWKLIVVCMFLIAIFLSGAYYCMAKMENIIQTEITKQAGN